MTKRAIYIKMLQDENDALDNLVFELLMGEKDASILNLPEFVKWPNGSRKASERAYILMRAGLAALKKEGKPAAKETEKEPKKEDRKGAVTDDIRAMGF